MEAPQSTPDRTRSASPPPTTIRAPLTVSQVTSLVKIAIERSLPTTLSVLGEISNFKKHSSGHLYFTLKDAQSELACVMWRSQAEVMRFAPRDGMEVIATGTIEVFERSGRYQLYVRKLEPRGTGALELAFRQLCEKLSKEGLFDERRKRPLPRFPQRIAIVTSPTGAAIADMLKTITRRFPCVTVLVDPVRVQGPGSAGEIAAAIHRLNRFREELGGIDVIIVGRGGGSLEDLWAFNEEIVARAIHASAVPVVSAVGHETDVTIADFVADLRAPTPTAAAELVVPVLSEVLAGLDAQRSRLDRALRNQLRLANAHFSGVLQRRSLREPLLTVFRRAQILDELGARIERTARNIVLDLRDRLARFDATVQRIAPQTMLLRCHERFSRTEQRFRWGMARRMGLRERMLVHWEQQLVRAAPDRHVEMLEQRVEQVSQRLSTGIRHRLAILAEQIAHREEHLGALSYRSILRRGFSITRIKQSGKVLRSPAELADHARLVTQLAEGEVESEVVNLRQLDLFG